MKEWTMWAYHNNMWLKTSARPPRARNGDRIVYRRKRKEYLVAEFDGKVYVGKFKNWRLASRPKEGDSQVMVRP
jgi:hypothetical protein